MKKNWKWAVLALALAGVAVLGVAEAKRGDGYWGGMGMMHRGGPLGHLARHLDLTDAQKTQIKSMWEAEKPTAMPLIQQLADGRKQMIALTANGSFDQAKVQTVAAQQSQALAQLIVEKEKLQAQIYNQVLTPDQRTKVDQMQQKRTERIDQWLQRIGQKSGE